MQNVVVMSVVMCVFSLYVFVIVFVCVATKFMQNVVVMSMVMCVFSLFVFVIVFVCVFVFSVFVFMVMGVFSVIVMVMFVCVFVFAMFVFVFVFSLFVMMVFVVFVFVLVLSVNTRHVGGGSAHCCTVIGHSSSIPSVFLWEASLVRLRSFSKKFRGRRAEPAKPRHVGQKSVGKTPRQERRMHDMLTAEGRP